MNFDLQQFIAENQTGLFISILGSVGVFFLLGGIFQWTWLLKGGFSHRGWISYLIHNWIGDRAFYILIGILFIFLSLVYLYFII